MKEDPEELSRLAETTVRSESVFDGTLLHVRRDDVTLPNGGSAHREYIRHQGAVAIVPIAEDGSVIMERQFRYPLGGIVTEIPAGKLDSPDEDRLEAAKRELREETGLTAENWLPLGDYYPSPAYSDERISLYLATGLSAGAQSLDFDEFLDVCRVPLMELVSDVLNGLITDGKTQTALLKAALVLNIQGRENR